MLVIKYKWKKNIVWVIFQKHYCGENEISASFKSIFLRNFKV